MKIITVTEDGDDQRSFVESFDDKITSTPWWDAVAAEYCDAKNHCVGHGAGGGHVHLPSKTFGPSYSDDGTNAAGTFGALIYDSIQNGTLPVPDAHTVFALYIPSTTNVTNPTGDLACRDFYGYHSALTMTPPGASTAITVPYFVIPRCVEGADILTYSASHELVEMATDPFITARGPAFTGFADAWDLNGGGEVGDRCLFEYEAVDMQSRMTIRESGFAVQRTWSNKQAAAGHDPCVPAPAPSDTAYFNVIGTEPDVITLAVGASKTIELTAFADAPLSDAMQVEVSELTKTMGASDVLDLTIDESTCKPGDKLHVTVKLRATPNGPYSPDGTGRMAVFQVASTVGGVQNFSLFAVKTH
jgi:hypothetical protein